MKMRRSLFSLLQAQIDGLLSAVHALIGSSPGKTFASVSFVNPSPTVSGITTSYSLLAYVPKSTGTVTISGNMSVSTSAPGTAVNFTLLNTLTPIGPNLSAESGGTVGNASAEISYTIPCVEGVHLSPGIRATVPIDATVQSPANGASITIVENQTS